MGGTAPAQITNAKDLCLARRRWRDETVCWPVNPHIGNVRDNAPSLLDRSLRSTDQTQDPQETEER
jgi:hypothetical protein